MTRDDGERAYMTLHQGAQPPAQQQGGDEVEQGILGKAYCALCAALGVARIEHAVCSHLELGIQWCVGFMFCRPRGLVELWGKAVVAPLLKPALVCASSDIP